MNLKRIAKVLEDTNELKVQELILDSAQKKKQIIYGARALNRQLPTHLRVKTYDYDILTNKPRKSALELAKQLKPYTSQKVSVVKARHKGTYKVKIGDKTVVDYTQIKRTPKTKRSWGNSYREIKSMQHSITKSSRKKGNEFRKEKDLDALRRIKKAKKTFKF